MEHSISFKYRHLQKEVILLILRWYLSYSLSYRNIEEMMLERGISVDHSTITRWVIHYAPLLEKEFRKKYKRTTIQNYDAFQKNCDRTLMFNCFDAVI